MKEFKMELFDWKQIERTAEEQFRASNANLVVSKLLYEQAVAEIHKLGGRSNEEEDAEAQKEIKKST